MQVRIIISFLKTGPTTTTRLTDLSHFFFSNLLCSHSLTKCSIGQNSAACACQGASAEISCNDATGLICYVNALGTPQCAKSADPSWVTELCDVTDGVNPNNNACRCGSTDGPFCEKSGGGLICDTTANAACKCEPGQFRDTRGGYDVCVSCEPGRFLDGVEESGPCSQCPAGLYGTEIGRTTQNLACVYKCSAGKFSTQTGLSRDDDCISCGAGKFSDSGEAQTSSSVCKNCKAGYWVKATGRTSEVDCKSCEYGRYASEEGRGKECDEDCDDIRCGQCALGQFSDEYGLTSKSGCKMCTAGKYSDAKNGVWNLLEKGKGLDCKYSCVAGKYSTEEGQLYETTCKICPAGYWIDTLNSTACTSCRGTFLLAFVFVGVWRCPPPPPVHPSNADRN